MATDPLQQLLGTIIPLSSLPKTNNVSVNADLPPLRPLDKTSTTKRMNHELTVRTVDKLAERVESMIESVNEAKLLVIQTNGKLNEAMDRASENHTTIVNRSQERVLETMGQPAQSTLLQELAQAHQNTLELVKSIQQVRIHRVIV
ncbi:hypothetical protein CPB86DRAFT_782288 [Serendipita vermifera]|nr:hypothetical protein CPB86DRAFT_782288 [Serendipita vermifera]